MKFTITLIIVLIAFQMGSAQKIEKTTKLMGGTLEIRGVLPDDDPNTFAIDLNPVVGLFVADNLAVGPGLNLAYANTSDTDTEAFKFGISPLVRYYIGEGNMKVFGQGTLGYNWVNTNTGEVSDNDDFYNAGLGMGVAMFPVRAVGVEMSVNYLRNPRFNNGVDAIMLRVGIFAYKRPKQ
jgi:hypothetical protein